MGLWFRCITSCLALWFYLFFISFSKLIQVLPDNMGVVRKALREMQPHVVACGPVGAEKPDEVS